MNDEYEHLKGLVGPEVVARFGADGIHFSCLGYDGERKLRYLLDLARSTYSVDRPLHVLEVGTHRGVSSTIMATSGLDVITFDIEVHPLREEIWEHFNVRTQIDARACEGNADLAKKVERIAFDIAFIDGNHEYKSVADNFAAVKHCGRVVFHDYEHKRHAGRTVKFVDELPAGQIIKLTPFALWLSHGAVGTPKGLTAPRG